MIGFKVLVNTDCKMVLSEYRLKKQTKPYIHVHSSIQIPREFECCHSLFRCNLALVKNSADLYLSFRRNLTKMV